jgi:type I restriction enzyme M protein
MTSLKSQFRQCYRHKPLRSIEEVSADILKLEAESDELIREILSLN